MLVIFFLVDLPRMVQQAVDLVPVKVPDGNDMPRNYPPGSLVRLLDVPVLITYLFLLYGFGGTKNSYYVMTAFKKQE